MDLQASARALRAPFPTSVIGKKNIGRGVVLDYVGHAAITDRLLAVDPSWGWEPLALTPSGLPLLDDEAGLWIRLTVAGVTRLGYGAASAGEGRAPGDKTKERIGDALRNAAMRFGVGLDLWSKEDLPGAAEAGPGIPVDAVVGGVMRAPGAGGRAIPSPPAPPVAPSEPAMPAAEQLGTPSVPDYLDTPEGQAAARVEIKALAAALGAPHLLAAKAAAGVAPAATAAPHQLDQMLAYLYEVRDRPLEASAGRGEGA